MFDHAKLRLHFVLNEVVSTSHSASAAGQEHEEYEISPQSYISWQDRLDKWKGRIIRAHTYAPIMHVTSTPISEWSSWDTTRKIGHLEYRAVQEEGNYWGEVVRETLTLVIRRPVNLRVGQIPRCVVYIERTLGDRININNRNDYIIKSWRKQKADLEAVLPNRLFEESYKDL